MSVGRKAAFLLSGRQEAGVDEQKNHWAYCNGFKLIRIWEHDINNHPEKVLKMLKEELYIGTEEKNKKDNMKKRH